MSIYYTYRLVHIETGQFYIGSKSSKVDPYLDLGIKYQSSSKHVKSIGFQNFYYGIIRQDYETYDDCYWDEQKMIKENSRNPLLLNIRYYERGKLKFAHFGKTHSEDAKMKMRLNHAIRKKRAQEKKRRETGYLLSLKDKVKIKTEVVGKINCHWKYHTISPSSDKNNS